MTTQRLLEIVAERGLQIRLVNGQLFLHTPPGNHNRTPTLLAVLTRHRERILQLMSSQSQQPQRNPDAPGERTGSPQQS